MTYTELVAAIQNYSENSFDYSTTPSILNRFIKQAEQTIYNAVQLPSLRKNVTGVTTTNNKYVSCPIDFLASFSFAVIDGTGSYTYLLNKDVNFIRQAYPSPTDTGQPVYYSLFGPRSDLPAELTFLLGPTPDAIYNLELHYYFYPESIVTSGTTWLGDNFDIALLNYSLMEALTYMKGEQDMVALYKSRAETAMVLLKQLGDSKEKGDSYRDGSPKYKVI
jgi:hypothetical protein